MRSQSVTHSPGSGSHQSNAHLRRQSPHVPEVGLCADRRHRDVLARPGNDIAVHTSSETRPRSSRTRACRPQSQGYCLPGNVINPEARAPASKYAPRRARPTCTGTSQQERTQRAAASTDASTAAHGRRQAARHPVNRWRNAAPPGKQATHMHGKVLHTLAFGTVHLGKADAQLMLMYAAKQLLYALSDVLPTCTRKGRRRTSVRSATGWCRFLAILGGVCGWEARNVAVHCLTQHDESQRTGSGEGPQTARTHLISQICKQRRTRKARQAQHNDEPRKRHLPPGNQPL